MKGGLHPGGSAWKVCIQGRGEVCGWLEGGGQTPPGIRKAGSTHPTGMLSCWVWLFDDLVLFLSFDSSFYFITSSEILLFKPSSYTYYQFDIRVNISWYQIYRIKTNGRIVVTYTTNYLHGIRSATDDMFIQVQLYDEQMPLAPVPRSFTSSNPV